MLVRTAQSCSVQKKSLGSSPETAGYEAEENTVCVAVVSKRKSEAVSCRTYEAAGTMVSVMGQ